MSRKESKYLTSAEQKRLLINKILNFTDVIATFSNYRQKEVIGWLIDWLLYTLYSVAT